jgi:hypothetical protein
MSMLSNLATTDDVADEADVIGGSDPVESGLYLATISMAYVDKSNGGAMALNLRLALDNGREVRERLWITSGDAKGNRNYYETKNGEKRYLPGFNLANSLCLLSVGKELAEMDTDEKVINIYSSEASKEVPTKVPVLVDLLNQEIIAGIQQVIVDKSAKDQNGVYQPTGETRTVNEIDKFFRAKDKLTTAEIRAQVAEAEFYNSWDKKWTGQVRDRSKGAAAPAGGATQSTAFAGNAAKPRTSLFAS